MDEQDSDDRMLQQYYPNMYTGEDPTDFSKWRFDVNEMLRNIEHSLIGEVKVKDKEGEEVWILPEGVTPTMTAEGAREIVSTCDMIVSKVAFLSGLELNEILATVQSLHIALADLLFDNYSRYEIDKSKLDMIVVKVTRFIFIALKQAQNARTLESLTKMEITKRVYNESKEKEGMKLNPFGGRGDRNG